MDRQKAFYGVQSIRSAGSTLEYCLNKRKLISKFNESEVLKIKNIKEEKNFNK